MTPDKAMLVQSEVLRERGMWVVYLEVWFDDGIERKEVGAYPSEAKARLAARWMTWAARREMSPPTTGM